MRIFSVANILRFLFLILSLYGFIVFLRPVFIGILNFGNAVGMLFFAVSALVCIFWPSFTRPDFGRCPANGENWRCWIFDSRRCLFRLGDGSVSDYDSQYSKRALYRDLQSSSWGAR